MASGTILVIGDLMIDVVVDMPGELVRGSDMPSQISSTFGGTAANVATWLAVCGTRVRVFGAVGSDAWGEQMLRHLESFGIESHVAQIQELPTGAVVALCHPDGERSFLPDARANSQLAAISFPSETWHDVAFLYVSGYTLLNPATRSWAVGVMHQARTRGISVVLDPASSGPLSGISSAEIAQWLELTDLLIPNDQEFAALQSLMGAQVSLGRLALKHGSHGVTVMQNGQSLDIPAAPAQVVDTIGAGDAFAAGILHGLNSGHTLEDSARLAVQVAAAAVSIRGAQPEASSTLDIH
jgi:sugar/nucleoside kinase (ribokinase family)